MKGILFHIGLAATLAAPSAVPAFANTGQDADESALDALDKAAPPVVVKQEPAGAADLRDAMRRIAQRPTDSFALTDAGYAAIKLGDYDAAFNFFSKANALQPADARIKSGLAIAQVRRENPFEALSLFDEAIRLGANERGFALDRALAYDLLGNFERAEKDYALAKSWGDSEELTLRHAISTSLAGRRDDADRMLIPMLQKEIPEAWRARALMLASRGDYKEAGKIAAGFLDPIEARRMDGYFRNMPRLTIAQQAAAMHFGHFPVGSNIGSDSEKLVTLAASTGVKPGTQGDSRLIPSGEPFGTKTAAAKPEKPKKPAGKKTAKAVTASGNLATSSAQQASNAAAGSKVATLAIGQLPPPEAARPPVRILLPALAPAKAAIAELPLAAPAPALAKNDSAELPATGPAVGGVQGSTSRELILPPVATAKNDTAPVVAVLEPTKTEGLPADVAIIPVQPGFDSVQGPIVADAAIPPKVIFEAAVPPSVPTPGLAETQSAVPPPVPAAITADSFDLAAIVGSIEVPDEEKRPSVAAVDLTKIKPAAQKAEVVPAKADLPAKTSKVAANTPRYFVQIATGSDISGLGFDFRRMAKKHGTLFAKQDGWTSQWGKTRRLLVGPFPDAKTAKKWEADLRKAGGDGFVWQSDRNTEVEKLKAK